MPTPFMHLQIAEQIQASQEVNPELKKIIQAEYPAFYLGNVAPDFQTICEIPREVTHFYHLPPEPANKGYDRMLAQNPQLADARSLPISEAVFLAGYCIHLILDLTWYHKVLVPYFLMSEGWSNRRERFVVHNTLLTYLDKLAVESLPANSAEVLGSVNPDYQLPFADDSDLMVWRDMLVEQLEPDAMLKTIEIYAGRLMMTPEEFAGNLDDPDWMEAHVFAKVPVEGVETILGEGVNESIEVISNYLRGIIS